MGVVWLAREPGLGRPVALKVLAPELASDEEFRERFLREMRLAASVDHPHVCPVYRAGEEDGLPTSRSASSQARPSARLSSGTGAGRRTGRSHCSATWPARSMPRMPTASSTVT